MKKLILLMVVSHLSFLVLPARATRLDAIPNNAEVPAINGSTGALEYQYESSTQIVGPIDDTAGQSETGRTFSANHILETFLQKVGGSLTGFLTLHAAPTLDLHASTKKYVDDKFASVPSFDGSNVAITGGTISGVALSYGSLSANGVKGMTLSVVAGESLAAFDVVAMRNASGTAKAYKYSCATADSDKLLLGYGIATAAISSGATGTILIEGAVRNSGWSIAAADTGKTVYASSTDGAISLTVPSNTGDIIQSLGRVVIGEAYTIYFRPSMDYGVKP
jgi:hypothetical protein